VQAQSQSVDRKVQMRDAQITRYVGDVHVHTRKTGARELDVAYDATRPLPTYMATESRACGGWQYKERVRWAMLALAVHGGVAHKHIGAILQLAVHRFGICDLDRYACSRRWCCRLL
jgi:hypothetical protein